MAGSLKIAFYTDTFLPAVDGVVVSILNFRKELQRRGHEVHIFAGGNSKSKDLIKGYKNIHIIRGTKFKKYPQYSLAFFPFYPSLDVMRMKFDLIHTQTPFMIGAQGLVRAKINRTPLASTFHTMFMDPSAIREYTFDNKYLRRFVMKYSWNYARTYYNSCDEVIAPSRTIRNLLLRNGIKEADVVPNSVDLELFNTKVDGNQIRERLGFKDRDRVIAYVGRVSKEKHLETMIMAARLIKEERVKFMIVGAGPALEHYKSLVWKTGQGHRFTFVGFVANKELPRYYAAADACCMPSKFETQGIASLEAMACGKPVIGADYLALKELIVNGMNGEKFRADDHYDCARKIRKVINNTSSYKDMSNTAKQYSVENTTDRLLDAYKKILDN
ncbi:MAG: glycosyltransferase [Candidatus Micrarchaeota archaeon]|nr:glycosyltransferase [Candidatus Micrarchaeota archaeon]